MTNIVVSYKSDERGRAGYVVALLEAAGFAVWWDDKLTAGTTYAKEIVAQIEQAHCVAVLWSRASVTSDWVRGEAKLADELGKLVPLWMEDVRIPPPFNVKHTLDLRHWMGSPSDPAWMNVIREVRRVVDPSGKTAMLVEKYADAAIARSGYLIHKLKARDTTGRWAYYFVLVPPEREAQFLRAIEGPGTIDLQDMGTVIASCYGEAPTPEVKAYLKSRYDFDV